MLPGISKMVIASPETKANLTCVYRRYSATPIWKGKLKIHETRLTNDTCVPKTTMPMQLNKIKEVVFHMDKEQIN